MTQDNIKIAFCFDKNIMYEACITIASLLKSGLEYNCHYDIYCIYSKGADKVKRYMETLVKRFDSKSTVTFIKALNTYDKGFEIRNITTAAYNRLDLPFLLKDLNKVIYSDVDVLFKKGLSELWNTNIDDYFFAGCIAKCFCVKEIWDKFIEDYPYFNDISFGKYFNSGFLLMNLKMIRESNIQQEWKALSKERLLFQDQDIINLTSEGRIKEIPLIYNVTNDINEINNEMGEPVVIHYTGEKPWNNPRVTRGDLWMDFVKSDKILHKLYLSKIYTPKIIKNLIKAIFSVEKKDNIKYQKFIVRLLGLKVSFKLYKSGKNQN